MYVLTKQEMEKQMHLFFVSLLLIVVLIFSVAVCSTTAAAVDDKAVLLQLKDEMQCATNCVGNWNNITPLCDFKGVACNSNKTAVTKLNLYVCECYGTLRGATISALRQLQELDVSSNPSLSGVFPPELARLTHLSQLLLAGTNLSVAADGQLPSSWGALRNLDTLTLGDGPLRLQLQQLPVSWRNFSAMNSFSLSYSTLKLFPDWICDRWRSLTKLRLDNNLLEGPLPRCIGEKLTRLGSLSLRYNRLSGRLPDSLGNLTRLYVLMLAYNKFTGVIPDEPWRNMGSVYGLQDLDLTGNDLGGPLPRSWPSGAGWQQCFVVLLGFNHLNGTLPASWGPMLRGISYFELQHNELSDEIPREWSELGSESSGYYNVLLNDNELSGELPQGLRAPLVSLDVSNNFFSGELPSSLVLSADGSNLDFSGNCFDINNTAINIVLRNSLLISFDITPNCPAKKMTPIATNHQLDSAYSFKRVNYWKTDPTGCGAEIRSSANVPVFTYAATRSFLILPTGLPAWEHASFQTSCVVGTFVPLLECFTNGAASTPCDRALLPPPPSWQNRSQRVPPLLNADQSFSFSAADAHFLHGATYRVKFAFVFNTAKGELRSVVVDSDAFQGPRCNEGKSIGIPLTTSCAPCPRLLTAQNAASLHSASCDGSVHAQVSDATPSWRPSRGVLPLYECPARTTRGCLSQRDRNASADAAEQLDGTHCQPNYDASHPLCARCSAGFGMVDGECEACPPRGAIVAVFASGVAVLIAVATLLIFLSLKTATERRQQIEDIEQPAAICVACCPSGNQVNVDCAQCECCRPLAARLERWRPQLERLVTAIRQLINHVSFVGALASTAPAQQMGAVIRAALRWQQLSNTFAFGSYAATLNCLMPAGWSESVLQFNLIWSVFAGVFVFEFVLFFVWQRRLSVAATVALFLGFVAYAPLTENAAKLLSACTEFRFYDSREYLLRSDLSGVAPARSYSLLASDLAQECTGDFRATYVAAGAATIGLFSLGLPLLIAFTYRRLAGRYTLQQEIFGFLTHSYREPTWFYELLVMARKLLVALILGVFPAQSALQLSLFAAVAAAALALSSGLMPLQTKAANRAEQLSISSAVVAATLMSLVTAFEGTGSEGGVKVFAAVGVVATQVAAVVAIVVFGHGAAKADELLAFQQALLSELEKDENDDELDTLRDDASSLNEGAGDIDDAQQLQRVRLIVGRLRQRIAAAERATNARVEERDELHEAELERVREEQRAELEQRDARLASGAAELQRVRAERAALEERVAALLRDRDARAGAAGGADGADGAEE